MSISRTPPLNTLRAFDVAARHGSFVQAATELSVTPAAISHRIKDLEQTLGVELFERKPRGVQLTDAGRRYRDAIATAFQIIEHATTNLNETTVDGPLTVSVPESFAQFWLVSRLSRLVTKLPGLELTLQTDSRLVDLRDRHADIGIRFGMGTYPGLESEYLLGDAVTVLAPASQLTGRIDARARAVLHDSALLEDYRTAPNEPWMTWKPWLHEAGIHEPAPLRTLRFSDAGMTVLACQEAIGVCIGRMSLVSDLVRQRRISTLFPWRSTELSYHLVTRSADKDNPRVLAFRSWLIEEVDAYINEVNNNLGFQLGRSRQ